MRKSQAAIAVQESQPPGFGLAQPGDFADSLISFAGFDPKASKAGRNEFVEAASEGERKCWCGAGRRRCWCRWWGRCGHSFLVVDGCQRERPAGEGARRKQARRKRSVCSYGIDWVAVFTQHPTLRLNAGEPILDRGYAAEVFQDMLLADEPDGQHTAG